MSACWQVISQRVVNGGIVYPGDRTKNPKNEKKNALTFQHAPFPLEGTHSL